MNINELVENKPGSIEKATIIEKEEPRSFAKFGKDGKVCNCTLEDSTGKVQLTLWNEQVDQFQKGDVITLKEGWVKSWNNQLQISTGRNGTIEKI